MASPAQPAASRGVLRHTSLTFGAKVAGAALGLGNVLIVARALGPSGRGSVAFVFATTLLVAQFASLGAHWAIPNLAGRDRRLLAPLLGNSLVLSLTLGTVAAVVVGVTASAVSAVGGHVAAGTRVLGLATIPILILTYCLLLAAQSESLFGLMNISMLAVPMAAFAGNVALAISGSLSVQSVVSIWVAAQAVGLVVLLVGLRRHGLRYERPDAPLARSMLGFGVRANIGQMGMASTYRLDQWLLGSIAGSRPLGLYSVAVAWAEVLFFLPEAVAMVQRPDLVRDSRRAAVRRVAAGLRATVALTLLSSVVVIVAAPFLCTTIFGADYAGSVRDLRVLALGAVGICAMKQLGVALMAKGWPLRETAAILVAVVVTVAADVLLIPAWGDLGASIASTVAYLAGGAAMVWVFGRTFGARAADLVPRTAEVRWAYAKARSLARREATSV